MSAKRKRPSRTVHAWRAPRVRSDHLTFYFLSQEKQRPFLKPKVFLRVSKKKVPGSVHRNRYRRLMRAGLHQANMFKWEGILTLRHPHPEGANRAFSREVDHLLQCVKQRCTR